MVEPVDIDPIDRDEIGDEDDEWGDDSMNDLEIRFNKLGHFSARLETSADTDVENITLDKNEMKKDTIELVANQVYDKIAKLINDSRKRLGIKVGVNIEEPIVNYDSFNLIISPLYVIMKTYILVISMKV